MVPTTTQRAYSVKGCLIVPGEVTGGDGATTYSEGCSVGYKYGVGFSPGGGSTNGSSVVDLAMSVSAELNKAGGLRVAPCA